MLVQTVALYCAISAIAASLAVLLAKRRFEADWFAYFVVGCIGGWVGGALFGAYGLMMAGVSVLAVAVCAGVAIEADYCIGCSAEDAKVDIQRSVEAGKLNKPVAAKLNRSAAGVKLEQPDKDKAV